MVDPASALGAVKQFDEAVGLIEKFLGKLRAQPDIAALKLSAALDEIAKTYRALDEAFTEYVSLALDQDALTTRSRELLIITGGSLKVRVSEGRGHCGQISNIYWQHLRRWFEKAFNRGEQAQIEEVFVRLGNADTDLFHDLINLADQLTVDSKDVLTLVMQHHEEEARKHVLHTYKKLASVQHAMAQGMQRMFALKDTFYQIARTA